MARCWPLDPLVIRNILGLWGHSRVSLNCRLKREMPGVRLDTGAASQPQKKWQVPMVSDTCQVRAEGE